MTRRISIAIACAAFVAANAFGGVLKVTGFPHRRDVITEEVVVTADPIVKLPPPVAPGMEKATNAIVTPTARNISSPKPATNAVMQPPADEIQKAKIKAQRARLNENTVRWQEQRAAEGSPMAMRSLAFRYLAGDGVEKNEAKGMDLMRKAAAAGEPAAQKELARREQAQKE